MWKKWYEVLQSLNARKYSKTLYEFISETHFLRKNFYLKFYPGTAKRKIGML